LRYRRDAEGEGEEGKRCGGVRALRRLCKGASVLAGVVFDVVSLS